MKTLAVVLLTIISCYIGYTYNEEIMDFTLDNFVHNKNITIENNIYSNENNYKYIKLSEDFVANDKKDLENILYSIINSGNNSFSFYCDTKYDKCIDDFNEIVINSNTFSELSNFTSPYNSYREVETIYNNYGKISVNIDKIYTTDMIEYVENEVDKIINEIITEDMSNQDKIYAFHNYIINNTKYDSSAAQKVRNGASVEELNNSNNAYGLLQNKLAICGGYSDITSIFLTKIGLNNIRISNDLHVWNLVYLDGEWVHLDLTWDDPVISDGSNALLYNYFLITTTELKLLNDTEHHFDSNIYLETKNN